MGTLTSFITLTVDGFYKGPNGEFDGFDVVAHTEQGAPR